NGGVQRGRNWLKIPNYSIRTLYWEYAIDYIQNLETGTINKDKLSDSISKMAYDGDYKSYFDFFVENILMRLSNRDLINFDEKYIKVMLLSTLFISKLYLPVSEDETTEGYTDIYLIKHPAIKDIKYEYIFEIKYIKTETTEAEKNKKIEEAKAQISRYKTDPRFTGKDDIKFLIVLFKGKKEYEIYV
ncbi:MAG: PD-(D/E)XK nuclease domain-containing protein, partial [Leptospirales bacterium]|nr:PD-(D/E)XK nuclease domain-containing protein [Leptospirales bacterium]